MGGIETHPAGVGIVHVTQLFHVFPQFASPDVPIAIDSLTYPCITALFSPTIHEIVDDAIDRIEKNFFKTETRIRQATGPNQS